MNSSPFDFDVVTGPPAPREQPKAPSRPESTREPQTGTPPGEPAPSK
ncbi:MAG TPA: hypothetical protein VMA37_02625 [Acetobacteraceae bacterium]|nr:hypothetical protein [Acetobacteraceae bacterium]